MYVTDIRDHSLFHFKVEAGFRRVATLGGRGSGIGLFNDPRQLAVSTNGDVFVTDRNNNRVQILDSELHYQRHISHHSMKLPIDVKLTPDEVFVLCQCSPCVKVFSYTGSLMRSLITFGSIVVQVINPSLFCLDTDGNLLLCDNCDYQIKIFSKEGILIQTLGKYGFEAGMFRHLQGISLINNLKLVVVSRHRRYSLQIYSSSSC